MSVDGSLPTSLASIGFEPSPPKRTRECVGVLDDVVVGDDVAAVVDDEARARRGPPAARPVEAELPLPPRADTNTTPGETFW
jgi:hypothetical protein